MACSEEIPQANNHSNKPHKGQKESAFCKKKNTNTNTSKMEPVNEIGCVSNNEIEEKDTPKLTNLSDLKISTSDSDF